jgi:hypothetical protein
MLVKALNTLLRMLVHFLWYYVSHVSRHTQRIDHEHSLAQILEWYLTLVCLGPGLGSGVHDSAKSKEHR